MGPLKVHNKQTIIQACRSGKGGRDERAPLLNHTKPYALNSTPPPCDITDPACTGPWCHNGGGRAWFGLGGPHAICGFCFFFTYFLIVSFFSTISCEWGSPLTTNESSVVKDAAARCLATSYLSKKQWKLPTEVLNFPTCIQIGNKNCVWTPKRYLHCQSFIQCMFLSVMFYY